MQKVLTEASNPELARKIIKQIQKLSLTYKEKNGRIPALMEVCGSHTMALARTGIKRILHEDVRLISGPGCPVCVTDQKSIDSMIELAKQKNRIVCTFGDMMRVPGSKGSLTKAKSEGSDIRVVYSPTDAVQIAKQNPTKEVIFLGIGFETTIPVLLAAIQMAEQEKVANFSMWLNTKLIEPILTYLLDTGEVNIDGFILPGHVSMIIGEESYQFLIEQYKIPGVISGFEAVEMLSSIFKLLKMLIKEDAFIENDYRSVVSYSGNLIAKQLMSTYLQPTDEPWRGIGVIKNSGLRFKDQYQHFDAKKKFNIEVAEPVKTKCRCGEIIRGLILPEECSLFGIACTPIKPIGPCMVSSEGTCAAHYTYLREVK